MNFKQCQISFLLFGFLLFSISCHEKKECLQFSDEIYNKEKVDSTELSQAIEYRNLLLQRFDETAIDSQKFDSYHLLFYSSLGYGKSIKFEKKGSTYSLSVKCILKEHLMKEAAFKDYKDYNISITKEDWDVLEQMIYDFNFWTANKFDVRKEVLDGYVYFLEGTRPKGRKCDKKTHQFIGRRSQEYDKMGALCEYICRYEEQLSFRYHQKDWDIAFKQISSKVIFFHHELH